jgi:hypothetical protein
MLFGTSGSVLELDNEKMSIERNESTDLKW